MVDKDFKEELLKLASEIRGIASDIKEQEQEHEKVAADSQDFSLGAVGGAQKGSDPLLDFILS